MRRLRPFVLAMGLMIIGGGGALSSAPAASATFFSCESCANVAGANEYPIDRVIGENASGTGLCVTLWRYNGGTSYTEMAKECSSTAFQLSGVYSPGQYTAHGDVKRWYECCNYHLIGDQIYE